MSGRILLGILLVAFVVPMGADERLVMRVYPPVSFAPANLRVQTVITKDNEHRSIEVVAEAAGFYRSSEIPLEGEGAPRITTVEFRSLPGGAYVVRATLRGAGGRELARVQRNIDVLEAGATEQ
jgi:hypothetical protein